ncbi:hypothetical protein MUK42_33860 [Musa troglodytarum]|uniref:Uncharacterized protein n=1 Tax=Musa troglodytarum TaxID=320322 RepID=A0A9E7H1E5_9LILI|nr:hypothetical protein MUK42_33860 [Musa troglodytarum]
MDVYGGNLRFYSRFLFSANNTHDSFACSVAALDIRGKRLEENRYCISVTLMSTHGVSGGSRERMIEKLKRAISGGIGGGGHILVKRPRLMLQLLQEELDSGLHALSIDAKTLSCPAYWYQHYAEIPKSKRQTQSEGKLLEPKLTVSSAGNIRSAETNYLQALPLAFALMAVSQDTLKFIELLKFFFLLPSLSSIASFCPTFSFYSSPPRPRPAPPPPPALLILRHFHPSAFTSLSCILIYTTITSLLASPLPHILFLPLIVLGD